MKIVKWRKKGDTRANVRTEWKKGQAKKSRMKVNTWHVESGEKK